MIVTVQAHFDTSIDFAALQFKLSCGLWSARKIDTAAGMPLLLSSGILDWLVHKISHRF